MATAAARWKKLNAKRDGILSRARACADITIPALMPPLGSDENSNLPTPYQSLGARGVNNLASKLTLTLLPSTSSFFRFQLDTKVMAELGNDKDQIEEALRQLENQTMKRVEAGNLRVQLHTAIKLLVATGNSLLHMPDDGRARVFNLAQYCVVRDPMGTVMEIVIQESVHPSTLTDEVRLACEVKASDDNDESVDVYTHVRRKGNKVEYDQEINELLVPGSEGRTNADESPYIPLRWAALDNEDYGRGHVEEYLGDLRSLEGLSKSVVAFAAAASKIIFLEHPNSQTDIDELREAESGEFVVGRKDDIDVLQVEKYPDFQVAKSVIEDLSLRLSHAFLLQSGTTRDAERVTAEEIRAQAQELEDVLGGVYTVQSQELQLPIVRRMISQEKKAGNFPKLPAGAVTPTIITGFDALGRGHELNRYRQYFSDGVALFGEGFMGQFDQAKAAQMLATQHNVDIADIKKSVEQIQADEQAAASGQLVDKAAGPVAGAVAGKVAENMVTP